jgi:hypothetical protein
MVQNVNPTFVKTPNLAAAAISTGISGQATVALYTGGANGSKINALVATAQNTTAPFDCHFGVSSGGTNWYIGTASVPISAGTASSVPSVNLMSNANAPLSIDSDGNPFLFLASSAWTLFIQAGAASSGWAANAVIQVVAPSIGDF